MPKLLTFSRTGYFNNHGTINKRVILRERKKLESTSYLNRESKQNITYVICKCYKYYICRYSIFVYLITFYLIIFVDILSLCISRIRFYQQNFTPHLGLIFSRSLTFLVITEALCVSINIGFTVSRYEMLMLKFRIVGGR